MEINMWKNKVDGSYKTLKKIIEKNIKNKTTVLKISLLLGQENLE